MMMMMKGRYRFIGPVQFAPLPGSTGLAFGQVVSNLVFRDSHQETKCLVHSRIVRKRPRYVWIEVDDFGLGNLALWSARNDSHLAKIVFRAQIIVHFAVRFLLHDSSALSLLPFVQSQRADHRKPRSPRQTGFCASRHFFSLSLHPKQRAFYEFVEKFTNARPRAA